MFGTSTLFHSEPAYKKKRNYSTTPKALFAEQLTTAAITPPKLVSSPFEHVAGTPPGSPVQQQSKKLICPQTPFIAAKATHPFVINALRIVDSMQLNPDTFIAPIDGMKGEHSQIYAIESDQQLVPGVANEDIYIKIFLENVLRKEGNNVEKTYAKNMLSQHAQLREAGFRVVTIYNTETARTDGYLIVEKLSKFHIPWNESSVLEDMSQKDKNHLDYLLSLFAFGLNNPSELSLDIHRGNFGLDKDDNLVLLDLMEENEDEPYAFFLYAKNHALSLSNGNGEIYEKFKNIAKENRSTRASALYSSMQI
jgi:hypothetical protein